MYGVKIELIDESINISSRGIVSGNLFFDFGIFQFPERSWNDAIIIVIDWWLKALVEFVGSDAATAELGFMDGPFVLLMRRDSGNQCQFLCLEGPCRRELFKCRGSAVDLLRSAVAVSTRLLRICGRNGWQSSNIDSIGELVKIARTYTKV